MNLEVLNLTSHNSCTVEIKSGTVYHFKATINAKVQPEGLESDGIFISY